jgi:hypothetical protein
MIVSISNSQLYYLDDYGIVTDYYMYIVKCLKEILINNPHWNINIVLGKDEYNFKNTNKIIRINLNYEHTLIRKDCPEISTNNYIQSGNIKDLNNNNYLIRIDRYDELKHADIIIDYSITNIYNVRSNNTFSLFSNKHIYISPSIYSTLNTNNNLRHIDCLTTFIRIDDPNRPRRKQLIDALKESNIRHTNINNVFNKDDIEKMYKDTKILINIHQTDYHHTAEELRILPALLCGVIVVCENSPLSNLIPYSEYIIWTSYENIPNKVKDILNDYDNYYNKIFNPYSTKKKSLDKLHSINYNTLYNSLHSQIYDDETKEGFGYYIPNFNFFLILIILFIFVCIIILINNVNILKNGTYKKYIKKIFN